MRNLDSFIAAAVLISFTGVAQAATVSVVLTGAQEVPPVATQASGNGTFTLNANNTISFNISFSNLTPQPGTGLGLRIAHIHGSTNLGTGVPGVNAPVLVDIVGGVPPAGIVAPAAGVLSGVMTGTDVLVSNTFLQALALGQTYFNIHSQVFPAGELRGQIGALSNATVIPLPGAALLWLGGLAMMAAVARRRRV